MHVIGYCRVSTQEQAAEGISLQTQRATIQAYCAIKDWTLIEVIVDEGVSAKNLRRPGAQVLLDRIQQREADVVIVYKPDRLTRSIYDLGRLLELCRRSQVTLVSIEEAIDPTTATGRLIMNVLAAVSHWEREVAGERTKEALAYLQAQGKTYCHARFGTRPEDDRILAMMQQARAAGQT